MRDAIAELFRLVRQLRTGVPWESDRVAFGWVPVLAIALSWGVGVSLAGTLWCVSKEFLFHPLAFVIMLLPACSGFYFTYLFDLLGIGLGWRTIEVLVHALISIALFMWASPHRFGLLAGVVATVCTWSVSVRCGSDLVAFRPDKLKAGNTDEHGVLSHPGLHRLCRSLLGLFVIVGLVMGCVSRWQQEPAPWWIWIVTGVGTALAAAAGLSLLGWARSAVELRTWQAADTVVNAEVSATWRQWVWRSALAASVAGVLLPANVSPWSKLSFNAFFLNFNSKVAPYFVRMGRHHSSSPVNKSFTVNLEPRANPPMDMAYGLVLLVVLVGVVIYVICRMMPYMRVRRGSDARPANFTGDWEFWRWLWEALRNLIRGIRGIYNKATGWLLDSDGNETVTNAAAIKRKARRRMPTEPRALVRFLFARFLEMGAANGRQRTAVETAQEYQARLAPDLAPEDLAAVQDLTLVYQRVRYGAHSADESLAAKCKRFWADAVRALRRIGR